MAAADAASVRELAAALAAARNPIIITEELGKSPAAVLRLVELAEALAAPVFEGWHPDYANFPRGHSLYGGIAVEEMPALLEESDFVFLVEAVAPWHPPGSLPRAGTRVAMLGEDPLHSRLPLWNFRADLVVTGEAGASLAAIVEEVRRVPPSGSRRAAMERWRERNARVRKSWRDEALACARREPIDTRWVMHELNALLPRDAIVVDETITHRIDMHRQLDRLEPGDFFEASYGGLGMGLGTALGIKAAHPARPVTVLIGDGAFHYNPVMASFGAAQEHGLPLLVVLFDNSGYLSQKGDVVHEFPHGHAVKSGRFVGTSISPRPDYPLLARAYGGWGERVESPHDLREVLARGLAAAAGGQLALVHVVLAPVDPGQVGGP
jgi:acetolactate synthase-1/2/3 large subunit